MKVAGPASRAIFLTAAMHAYASTVHAYALRLVAASYNMLLSKEIFYMEHYPNRLSVQAYGVLAANEA